MCVCGTDLRPLIIRQPVSTESKGGQHHMACQPVFVYTMPYVLIPSHGNTGAAARGSAAIMQECGFYNKSLRKTEQGLQGYENTAGLRYFGY